jgi:hypothetical protein
MIVDLGVGAGWNHVYNRLDRHVPYDGFVLTAEVFEVGYQHHLIGSEHGPVLVNRVREISDLFGDGEQNLVLFFLD